jgi:hypothetical protein
MEITDKQAANIVENLRQVRADAFARLDEFTLWVELISASVTDNTDKHILRWMGSPDFAELALEKLEAISHIHTGSTGHMHFRHARRAIIGAGQGEDI